MRVGLAVVRPFTDPHRRDAFGDDRFRHAVQMLIKALKPEFEIHTIRQNQLCFLRAFDIARRGLILMDFSARFGNRCHFCGVSRHVFRHISDNSKGGYDLELFSRQRARRGAGYEQCAEQQTLQSLP